MMDDGGKVQSRQELRVNPSHSAGMVAENYRTRYNSSRESLWCGWLFYCKTFCNKKRYVHPAFFWQYFFAPTKYEKKNNLVALPINHSPWT
jgi:hypothetical protein